MLFPLEGACFEHDLLSIPLGTGKTLLARAVAKQLDANFLKVVSSAIVDKYIGESARLIREMFGKWVHWVETDRAFMSLRCIA